jgi:nucleotide-binding universal stress UspA family protein
MMTIKNILVPFASAASGPHVLEAAIALGNRYSAHISVLHVRPDPTALIPYIVGPMPSDMLVQISENAEKQGIERSVQAQAKYKQICIKHGVSETPAMVGASVSWREVVGNVDFVYGLEARLSDLAIIAQPQALGPDSLVDILESVLFRSGRPVLMLPAKAPVLPGKKIIIAWNGSLEATRALAASLPFLKAAEDVILLTIGEDVGEGPGGEEVKNYLTWHEIKARIVNVKEAEAGEGAGLLAKAHELKADMVVMGAYSHSRLREFILGGVTQHVIDHADIAVLLLH